MPLFKELQALEQSLDRDEFIDAGLRLYEVSELHNLIKKTNFFML